MLKNRGLWRNIIALIAFIILGLIIWRAYHEAFSTEISKDNLEKFSYLLAPINLIATLGLAYFVFRISRSAYETSKSGLEQNRPIIYIPDNEVGKNIKSNITQRIFSIINRGDFEASNLKIYFKMTDKTSFDRVDKDRELYMSPSSNLKQDIKTTQNEIPIIITYKNALTLKRYIYCTIINFNNSQMIEPDNKIADFFQSLISLNYLESLTDGKLEKAITEQIKT